MDLPFVIKEEEEVNYLLTSHVVSEAINEKVCDEYSTDLPERISDIKEEPNENSTNLANESSSYLQHDTGSEKEQTKESNENNEISQKRKRRAKTTIYTPTESRKKKLAASVTKAVTSSEFLKIGNKYTKTGVKRKRAPYTVLREFKSFFGVTPQVCAIIWDKFKDKVPYDSKPMHLLWCLNFLKQYTAENIRRRSFKADEKSIRKWTWIFMKLLSDLDVINWDRRFDGEVKDQTCFCSLDGVDFRIVEPKPYNGRFYSPKFRGAGLRYEIALNIATGHIVWKHGGYPCGQFSDLKVARRAYIASMRGGELTMADKEYKDEKCFILPNETNKEFHKLVMSRHDIVNKRMKRFQALKVPFKHDLEKHPMAFHAIANLVQLSIENGEPLFEVA